MATKTANTCLKDVLVVLRLLANTEQKNYSNSSSEGHKKNSFDERLRNNLLLVRETLENYTRLQGLEELQKYFAGDLINNSCVLSDGHEINNGNSCKEEGLPNITTQELENDGLLKAKTKTLTSLDAVESVTTNSQTVRWIFVQVCLQTLNILREVLQRSKDCESGSKGAPMDLLSVNDQRVVSTILQLVVVLGICPNLLPGVGISIEQRSGFSHVLKTNSKEVSPRCPKCLHEITISLVKCLAEPALSMRILSRHFVDILSSLLQLAYSHEMCSGKSDVEGISSTEDTAEKVLERTEVSRQTSMKFDSHKEGHHKDVLCCGGVLISQAEREECAKALRNIIDKVYQPLVVRELLFLQGTMAGPKPMKKTSLKEKASKELKMNLAGTKDKTSASKTPSWMKEVCGHLLTKCLMKKNGVQNVLRGILEGASGTSMEWKVCETIAELIANCPLQVQSPDDYYKAISPQVLALLHLPNAKLRQQYGRVSVQIILAMMSRYPDIAAKYIANPLMKPFLLATEESDCLKKCMVLVDERELTHCIEDLHKIFVAAPDSDHCVMRNIERIIAPLFELFCFTRHGVSHVRTAVQELLSTFLKQSNERDAMTMLYVLAFNELPDIHATKHFMETENKSSTEHVTKVHLMMSHCAFGYGEGGGVMLVRTDLSQGEMNAQANSLEDILGEEKNTLETRALCLVEILENLRSQEDVPGNFFLYLLRQVQKIILDPNFEEIKKMKALMIFQVLALMCEKLGPSVLKNAHHMITFIDVTLTRAHHVYVETSSKEPETGAFELETLTMALGMLSALLSGAVKVNSSDYVKLQGLVPLLQQISDEYIEDEIRELANDLLVLILTRQVVLSEKESKVQSKDSSNNEVTSSQGKGNGRNPSRDRESPELQSADFDKAFELLCDPLLPARGHALMRLAGLLRSRDAKALEKVDILVKTFQDNLIHDDSYIYLAAVEGLVAAADVRAKEVLPYLAREFITCLDVEVGTMRCEKKMEKGMYFGSEGERASKREHSVINRSITTQMKLGEALLRATKRCGELAPYYFESLVQAFLTGVKDKDSFIRASSLSNLGELCRLSPHTLPSVVHEIFYCVSSVLKSDEAVEVRQAAVLVITLILRGLGNSSVEVLADILKDLYQLLKLVESTDQDDTVRAHARLALAELEKIMKEQLFPRQRLVKNINVLP